MTIYSSNNQMAGTAAAAGVQNIQCAQKPGSYWSGYNNYINTCVNNPQVTQVRDNFFKGQINFESEFDNLRKTADSDIIEINNLMSSTGTVENANKIASYMKTMDAEERRLKEELAEAETKTEALNTQFVDQKMNEDGPKKKPYVIVLQDYILAALAISYLFFALIFTFLMTKKANYSFKTFILSLALFIVLGALIYSLIGYLA